MGRTVLLYGVALAVAAFALEWLEYRYLTRLFATEIYIVLVAAGFTVLGLWAGRRLTRQAPASPFTRNDAALRSLGVTEREYEVLVLLADGCANKEIARRLEVSPNTIKTHIARLYEKLEVGRRTQAVQKARALALIP
ncbi:MAG TPA: helix-turn-helix transcriptional regulator [Parvularcula sp.]|nr:helix-turn-helix transcriptional regulator [Parvularcula sp.]HBS33971.1 helix-turn-helix transcriptional regulator [Parvularcula sp.]